MIGQRADIGRRGLALVALVVLALAPATAGAETITFVNETKAPLVVQLAIVIRGRVQRDRPHQLMPGDKVRITLPGDKLVSVYDARLPNRILYQGTLPASVQDQVYSLLPDPRGLPRVILDRKAGAPPGP